MRGDEATPDENQVILCGRLAAPPDSRDLPSGDRLLIFRLTVRRPEGAGTQVDSIDCVSTRARVHRVLSRTEPDEWLRLTGSLRRRFWRGAAGVTQSRYAVDVDTLRRLDPRRPRSADGRRIRAGA